MEEKLIIAAEKIEISDETVLVIELLYVWNTQSDLVDHRLILVLMRQAESLG